MLFTIFHFIYLLILFYYYFGTFYKFKDDDI